MTAYDVLGVAPDATPAQLRQAYHRAVLRVHPDRGSEHADAAAFGRVQDAWESLRSTNARSRYDTLSKPHEATPCQDVDLDDMRALADAAGAYRFVYPCRCGDSFVVAEASLPAGACSVVVPCGSCSASITVLYSPAVTLPEGDSTRMPTDATAGGSGTQPTLPSSKREQSRLLPRE